MTSGGESWQTQNDLQAELTLCASGTRMKTDTDNLKCVGLLISAEN